MSEDLDAWIGNFTESILKCRNAYAAVKTEHSARGRAFFRGDVAEVKAHIEEVFFEISDVDLEFFEAVTRFKSRPGFAHIATHMREIVGGQIHFPPPIQNVLKCLNESSHRIGGASIDMLDGYEKELTAIERMAQVFVSDPDSEGKTVVTSVPSKNEKRSEVLANVKAYNHISGLLLTSIETMNSILDVFAIQGQDLKREMRSKNSNSNSMYM